MTTDCKTCSSLEGLNPLSPSPIIYEGEYWQIEHAYPTSVRGWLVLVSKRHAQALHEITAKELAEAMDLLPKIIAGLHKTVGSQKEYVACFAEKPGFNHVHWHVIAKGSSIPEKYWGLNIFSLRGVPENESLSVDEISLICSQLQPFFKKVAN